MTAISGEAVEVTDFHDTDLQPSLSRMTTVWEAAFSIPPPAFFPQPETGDTPFALRHRDS